MTTLYKPVLIESVEQAEALPAGTLARHSEGAGTDHDHKIAAMLGLTGSHWVSSTGAESNAAMVGWTALVPIEAEEEFTHESRTSRGIKNFAPPRGAFPAQSHRIIAPWEEA